MPTKKLSSGKVITFKNEGDAYGYITSKDGKTLYYHIRAGKETKVPKKDVPKEFLAETKTSGKGSKKKTTGTKSPKKALRCIYRQS